MQNLHLFFNILMMKGVGGDSVMNANNVSEQ